jgi:hypothetical protein
MKAMKHLLNGAVIAAGAIAAGSVQAADLYRCVVQDGPAVYSDRPCGSNAQVVGKVPETRVVFPSRVTDNSRDVNVNVQVNNHIEAASAASASRASGSPRGLPFETFRRLDRGMSEGEILAIAGPPERETVDGIDTHSGLQFKSYYYVSEGYNANVTRIRFTNGTVTEIDRNRPPY